MFNRSFASPELDGLKLQSGFSEIESNRYIANKTFKSVRNYIHKQARGKSSMDILEEKSFPGIKYIYVRNFKDGRNWDGLHFYSTQRGKVELYVIQGLTHTVAADE